MCPGSPTLAPGEQLPPPPQQKTERKMRTIHPEDLEVEGVYDMICQRVLREVHETCVREAQGDMYAKSGVPESYITFGVLTSLGFAETGATLSTTDMTLRRHGLSSLTSKARSIRYVDKVK